MLDNLAKSYTALDVDSWRARIGFADDLEKAMAKISAPETSDDEVKRLLGDWLAKNQPCLFGRIAAKKGLLVYCILREADLLASDELVRRKIQQARLEWHRQGWNGAASGFVLVGIFDKLALATPGPAVLEIAKRLGHLYLNCDMEPDQIYVDEVFLEIPNRPRSAWRWAAGVNYFSAQGDQSCEMQLHELREYVSRRGWEVFGEYVDTGFSGAASSRPRLDQLLRDARLRKLKACWSGSWTVGGGA
jgi:hypothetical protein